MACEGCAERREKIIATMQAIADWARDPAHYPKRRLKKLGLALQKCLQKSKRKLCSLKANVGIRSRQNGSNK